MKHFFATLAYYKIVLRSEGDGWKEASFRAVHVGTICRNVGPSEGLGQMRFLSASVLGTVMQQGYSIKIL